MPAADVQAEFEQLALVSTPADSPGFAVSDIGCTESVAGAGWYVAAACRMARYGLQPGPTDDATTFRGLGDAPWEDPLFARFL